MIEEVGRKRVGRRAWPWMVLAVLASAVPFVLMVMTESGGIDYLPIVSFAWRFIGADARFLFPVDVFLAGGLPLLVLVAAGASWQWWPTGMAGATLLSALAVVNLVLFVEYRPRPFTPADISAGSQPDFHTGFGSSGMSPLLAAIACTAAAVALSVGARRMRANRRR
ncbi:hypothetical protein [Microtetraspora malaysiensis]|uniref:hypothetical protein n=1 Tax=Microtetraspora malaysiensis TaxID=161358 RepID=UPI0012F83E07|nr:hypothetical protein [Microtetraspora malaysiensis]